MDNGLIVHSSRNVSDSGSHFTIGGISCCKSPRSRGGVLLAGWLAGCFAAASAAEEWNGWRLIHVRQVHPAAASSIDAPVHSELASLWMLEVWTREPLISSTKYPSDRWQSAACVRACVQAWMRIGMSIANAFPE